MIARSKKRGDVQVLLSFPEILHLAAIALSLTFSSTSTTSAEATRPAVEDIVKVLAYSALRVPFHIHEEQHHESHMLFRLFEAKKQEIERCWEGQRPSDPLRYNVEEKTCA